nr:hypothetical protein [Planctomycetota bacterium]
VLAGIARTGGGVLRDDLIGLYDNPPSPGDLAGLATLLVGLALAVLVAEIAVRRLQVSFGRRTRTTASAAVTSGPVAARTAPAPTSAPTVVGPAAGPERDQGLHEALRQLKKRRGE